MAGLSIRFRVTNRLALFCDVSSQKKKKKKTGRRWGEVLKPTALITYVNPFKLKMGAFDCKPNSYPTPPPLITSTSRLSSDSIFLPGISRLNTKRGACAWG